MSNRAWVVVAVLMLAFVAVLVYDALGELDNPLDPTVQPLSATEDTAVSPPGETAR